MRKFFTVLVMIIVIVAVGAYFLPATYVQRVKGFFSVKSLDSDLKIVEKALNQGVEKVVKTVSNPPPLIAKLSTPKAFLTHDGVLLWTNKERKDVSALPALAGNITLDLIAEKRLKDMFDKQYFEHISPQGIGAADIAEEVGYSYISIGENIALGNFENDEKLVEAWMNSPGHRANILNTKYTEIGIAVGKGTYEGRSTWIGVQVFGRPLSSCPAPDKSIKNKITDYQTSIDNLVSKINALESELQTMPRRTREEVDAYNQKVEEYNQLVRQVQTLSAEAKSFVEIYNTEVRTFNTCIAT